MEVTDPDGRTWRVTRRWVTRRPVRVQPAGENERGRLPSVAGGSRS